jgi:hypothetical protein
MRFFRGDFERDAALKGSRDEVVRRSLSSLCEPGTGMLLRIQITNCHAP